MTPEQWRKVKEIFQRALEADEAQRASLLDEACQGEPGLRAEVDSLLACHANANDFLEKPEFDLATIPYASRSGWPGGAQPSIGIGTVLQDRYRIMRRIGSGGMGAVYEAKDLRLGITVALKQITVAGGLLQAAFEREARLLASLRHPALPAVTDHFFDGDGQYLVMQYIAGRDLAELLNSNHGPFEPAQVVAWADKLLEALDYLHSQRPPVIHRDIKPNNLKLADSGEIYLLDFGLAKGRPADSRLKSDADSLVGYTPHYAPPEQIEDRGTDARSDIYGLGATLYHLFTGVKPADAARRAICLVNGEADPLEPADKLNTRVPPELAQVIAKAMALRPDDRFYSATALRQALHGLSGAAGTMLQDNVPTLIKERQTRKLVAAGRGRRWALLIAALMIVGVLALPVKNLLTAQSVPNVQPAPAAPKPPVKAVEAPRQFGDPGFQGDLISIDIENVALNDVLRFVSDNYKVNFIIEDSLRKIPVAGKVHDVPWGKLLESILSANNLTYRREGEIIIITRQPPKQQLTP